MHVGRLLDGLDHLADVDSEWMGGTLLRAGVGRDEWKAYFDEVGACSSRIVQRMFRRLGDNGAEPISGRLSLRHGPLGKCV